MKIRFNWKISALGNICLSILSIIIFSQPAFGYSMTNNPRVKEAFTSLLKESSINGRIAFSYNIGGNWEIYTVNPDGTEPTRVTNNTYDDYGPTWSPDGAKIAFYSRRPSTNPTIYTSQIYTMNADGTDEQCLTTEGIENVFPAWSHNGSTIAYSSYQNGNYDIYIMDADGNNKQGLTSTPESEALASWSPNDSEIVFSSNKNGNLDIYKIRINNRKISQITSDANNNETHPRVSPDGTKIVYETYGLQGGPATIWLVDVNGENPHQIQFGGATPSWSPDGKYIVFVSGKIFVMNPDGSNIQAVSSDFLNCLRPCWGSVVAALINIQPNTLNIAGKSTANTIACYITLPSEYDISLVNTNSIHINLDGTNIFALSDPIKVKDQGKSGKSYIMVKFDRSAVINALGNEPGKYIEIIVSGKLINGIEFKGSDVIRIISH